MQSLLRTSPILMPSMWLPHDIAVHDLGTGISRWKIMHDLGITFIRYDSKQPGIDDGIEAVRSQSAQDVV